MILLPLASNRQSSALVVVQHTSEALLRLHILLVLGASCGDGGFCEGIVSFPVSFLLASVVLIQERTFFTTEGAFGMIETSSDNAEAFRKVPLLLIELLHLHG